MSYGLKIFLIVYSLFAVVVGTVITAGAIAYKQGAVRVEFEEKYAGGHHLRFPIPAALIPWGLKMMPEDVLEEATAEIKPFLPALLAASEELQDLPDFVLVEMQNSREWIRIEKRGESVLFDLESEHETIHLSIPVETIHSVLLTLEAGSKKRT